MGQTYPGKEAKFWGQLVFYETKFLKFGPKRAKLGTLVVHNVHFAADRLDADD